MQSSEMFRVIEATIVNWKPRLCSGAHSSVSAQVGLTTVVLGPLFLNTTKLLITIDLINMINN